MRKLSAKQASACENAIHDRCRCRCSGTLHGAKRVERLSELPTNDPHYIGKKKETNIESEEKQLALL